MGLFEKLRAGTENRKIIEWPGCPGAIVGLRVLNDNDYHVAGLAADNIYKAAGVKIAIENAEAYEAEIATQLLYRALSNSEDGSSVAPDITQFRTLLTKGVREKLIDEMQSWQAECSPSPGNMDEGAFDVLFARVKKNASETVQSVSDIAVLKKLIITLASQLSSSQTDS